MAYFSVETKYKYVCVRKSFTRGKKIKNINLGSLGTIEEFERKVWNILLRDLTVDERNYVIGAYKRAINNVKKLRAWKKGKKENEWGEKGTRGKEGRERGKREKRRMI